jgi:hypothetical protein
MNGPNKARPAVDRGANAKEDHMSAEYSATVPKRGDRVGVYEKEGSFEVVDVNTLMQTASVKSADEHVTRNIPWTALKFHQGTASR